MEEFQRNLDFCSQYGRKLAHYFVNGRSTDCQDLICSYLFLSLVVFLASLIFLEISWSCLNLSLWLVLCVLY